MFENKNFNEWRNPQLGKGIQLIFDSSLHFHFGQSWQGYTVNAIPSIIKEYRIIAKLLDESIAVIAIIVNNFQRNCYHDCNLNNVLSITLECVSTNGIERAQVYSMRVFENVSEVTKQ